MSVGLTKGLHRKPCGQDQYLHPPKDEEPATAEQKEENRTCIGCLSWLAKQTRPDLQFVVSQAQRKQQQSPTVGDLKQTNKIVSMSLKHSECGLRLNKIEEKDMCFIAYHDATWGNVSPEGQDFQSS